MLMASVMVLGATACGGSEAPADSAAGDMPTVGVLIYKYDDTYISTVRNALEAALDGKAEVIMQDGKGDQATQNDQLDVIKEKGVDRYEVSNFAVKGFESRHNYNYWERGEYIGVGVSASSFIGFVFSGK